MKLLIISLFVLIPSLSYADVNVRSQGQKLYWEGDLLDYGAEIGLGRDFGDKENSGLLRLRVGYTIARQSIFMTAAPCIDLYNNQTANFGLHLEAMNFERGVWFAIEPFTNKHLNHGVNLSVGFSLIGYEMEVKKNNKQDLDYTHFLKLKLPVSILVWALNKDG